MRQGPHKRQSRFAGRAAKKKNEGVGRGEGGAREGEHLKCLQAKHFFLFFCFVAVAVDTRST